MNDPKVRYSIPVNGLAVQFGSPADTAGLREGDVITVINGISINSNNSLATVIRNYAPG